MTRQKLGRGPWTGLRIASVVAACAGALSAVSDGSAAPPLQTLDPRTGLPQTWDSHIGQTRDPSKGRNRVMRNPNAPTPTVDACHHYDKTACADPTFTTRCPNAAQACSAYKELDACAANPPPAGTSCGDVLASNHQAQLKAITPVRRIVPSRASLATQLKPVTFVKFDRSKITVSGMDHSFATRLAHPALLNPARVTPGKRAPVLTYMQAAVKKVSSGGASGLIDSCDEYGARKYLSLTQFDAAVTAAQRDPRATYDLIYNTPQFSPIVNMGEVKDSEGAVSTTAPTASLDVLGNIVINPAGPLHFSPVQQPRNQFLSVGTSFGRSFSTPAGSWAPVPSLGLPDYSYSAPVAAAMAAYQKSSEIFFNQVLFTQRPFTSKDSPTIKETFAWHSAKNGALWEPDSQDQPGKFTDEELRVRYDRQQSLQGLLSQRYEIVNLIANVGTLCRTPTEPPPIQPEDANSLSNLAVKLTTYASQIDQLVGTAQYLSTVDPLFESAGVSKGWSIWDPIANTQTVFHGPSVQGAKWQVQYDNYVDNGPYVFFGSGCRSQIGCTAIPVKVTQGEILRKVVELQTQAAQATAFNNNLPKMRADAHEGFLESLNAANAECERYGISPMFASNGIPIDPNVPVLTPPTLSPAEAQRFATALNGNILPKLAAVDALIAEQLNAGAELSCFDLSPNGCDWSPNRLIDFVHSYRKEMDAQREADVQRCELYTTHSRNSFTYKAKLNDLMKSKGYNWDASRKTVKAFEKFLVDGESEMLKQLKDEVAAMVAMQTYDEDGKTPAIGQVTGTDGGFGGDMFGASYGAGGGFRFGNLSTDAQGHFTTNDSVGKANNFTYWAGNYGEASVNILGSTCEVFNARMDIAVTDGHVLDLQKGVKIGSGSFPTDYMYDNGQVGGGRDYVGEKGGVQDTYNKESQSLQGADKDRIVQGHLHFRVVGDDLFSPVNKALKPRVYASTEPIYSFEPASFNETLFDESTTVVIVIIPVTIRGWATFEAGVNYSIAASLDRPNIDSLSQKTTTPTNRTPFQLNNTIEPYAEIDGNVSVAVGVPGLEVGLKGSLELIRLGLPYHSAAAVTFFDGGASSANKSAGNRFSASQGLNFTLSTLSGTVSGFVQFLLWEAEQEIFGWDGITSTTPIFNVNEVDASVAMSSQAVRDLVRTGGFTVNQ
jgi:hypothetical protein